MEAAKFWSAATLALVLVMCITSMSVTWHCVNEVARLQSRIERLEAEDKGTSVSQIQLGQLGVQTPVYQGNNAEEETLGHQKEVRQFDLNAIVVQIVRAELEAHLNCSTDEETKCTIEPGPKGDPGPSGPPGPQGEKGNKGVKGDPGEQGQQGYTGFKGEKGQIGVQGLQGGRGERGEKGDMGTQGPVGEKGERGDTGPVGPMGTKGEKGHIGFTGFKGQKGEVGDQGVQGPIGERGGKGDMGPQGPSGGEKGDQGNIGPRGQVGAKGDKGRPGYPGFKGESGAIGIQGIKGPTGERGEKGDMGPRGPSGGEKGVRGATGPIGPVGAKGQPGSPGLKGERGEKGEKGPLNLLGPGEFCPKKEKGDFGNHLDNNTCDDTTGWTRIAYLDMTTNYDIQCPGNMVEVTLSEKRLCGRVAHPRDLSCASATFSAKGLQYTQVCGRIIGYQYGRPVGFYQSPGRSIESYYVDGVSVTHGPPGSREHVWTFATGIADTGVSGTSVHSICPCAPNAQTAERVPSFVGQNYFCESAYGRLYSSGSAFITYNPLWDGDGCSAAGSTCCDFNNPPYFTRNLTNPTSNDLEV